MKITILKACLVGILAACSILAYAGPKAGDYDQVIKAYIESHMNGNYKILKNIMDDNATFKIPRADRIVVQHKQDIVGTMKETGELKQNCTASYEVVMKSSALVIAHVDFCYNDCVQQNYVVLEKNEDKEWKIAQVYKVFNDKAPDVPGEKEKVIANN